VKTDSTKVFFVYGIAVLVLAGAFYGLVVYPYELDPLVKGALIAAATAAYTFVFGQEIAKATAVASQKAFDKGVMTPSPSAPSNGTIANNPVPGGTP
jgi:hypothetical protein